MFSQALQVSHLLVILLHLFYVLCHYLITQKQANVNKEFKTLHYVLLSKSVVDKVHITMKTENGSVAPFVTGKNNLEITFPRKKNSIKNFLSLQSLSLLY